MPTPRQRLAKIARIGLAIQAIAILPAVVAMMVSWNPSNQDSAFVQWCVSYWWSLLLLAAFVYTAVAYALSFLLRCPHCRYRLSRAYTPTWPSPATTRTCGIARIAVWHWTLRAATDETGDESQRRPCRSTLRAVTVRRLATPDSPSTAPPETPRTPAPSPARSAFPASPRAHPAR